MKVRERKIKKLIGLNQVRQEGEKVRQAGRKEWPMDKKKDEVLRSFKKRRRDRKAVRRRKGGRARLAGFR